VTPLIDASLGEKAEECCGGTNGREGLDYEAESGEGRDAVLCWLNSRASGYGGAVRRFLTDECDHSRDAGKDER
jgi:hypothetical protein